MSATDATDAIAHAITSRDGVPSPHILGRDVKSLTESVIYVASALNEIAEAIDRLSNAQLKRDRDAQGLKVVATAIDGLSYVLADQHEGP